VKLCLIGFAIFCYCCAATVPLHNSMASKGKSYQGGSEEKKNCKVMTLAEKK
jgi:hypothetical protein